MPKNSLDALIKIKNDVIIIFDFNAMRDERPA